MEGIHGDRCCSRTFISPTFKIHPHPSPPSFPSIYIHIIIIIIIILERYIHILLIYIHHHLFPSAINQSFLLNRNCQYRYSQSSKPTVNGFSQGFPIFIFPSSHPQTNPSIWDGGNSIAMLCFLPFRPPWQWPADVSGESRRRRRRAQIHVSQR